MSKIDLYTVECTSDIMYALKKIDNNKKEFLIVLKGDNVVGTLTDGDIRRAFIAGHTLTDSISGVYTQNYTVLHNTDGLSKAIDLFKNSAIKFLPVVNATGKLVNVITKNQLHAVLLQDIHADLAYDFATLDEGIVDYEIYQRPWGFYKTTVMNEYFQSKVISVNPKSQLSLQSHNHREEHWIVAHGNGTVQLDKTILNVACGSSIFIPKGCKHRLTNTDDKESLIITEVQIGDYFGEDDIIRYEDVYGRV